MTLTPKARELLARAAKPGPKVWNKHSGSGVRLAEARVCYGRRVTGVVWLVKYRGKIVAEYAGPDARQDAHKHRQTLTP